MYDEQTTEQAVEAFRKLSGDDAAKLKDLNTRIQNHTGEWGKKMGGQRTANGSFQETWTQRDPLISEFIDFVFEKGFGVTYVWADWNDDLAALFDSEEQAKYDSIDIRTALIMIGAAVRKDRGGGSTLARSFEKGSFPTLVNRLVQLKESNH